ncbi:maleylpyruvate isomerase family mycothiol-dependent enzyme [Streptacidiphilus jiangxiensis]|uniref:TIGR03083 family protein n=1 Tax=Streptacidiphilus jiangxiensis TaxID=235985 RepID=A0A1H7F5V5_STRJI|nr:maleylpyruvate isomerase family mycothiol-dependent enzyme [Streptacidiphilus jiangxiensis]SEK21368.1 TIGR03083 family protein [Streptacidiphilus jiangxiensis]
MSAEAGAETSALEGAVHEELRSLLGAWALDACGTDESVRLEAHLASCASCREEGHQLRDAAGWLSTDEPLDPEPSLRRQVLDGCLGRREPAFRVPAYAEPFVAETARLDALLRDLGELDWLERATLRWHGGSVERRPAEVLCHLTAVDGVLARALGLPDPSEGTDLLERDARLRSAQTGRPPTTVRALWRAQTRAIVETAALAPESMAERFVDYGAFRVPVADSFLDRAFECWIHAEDIAEAVGYPYNPPRGTHIRALIGLAVRLLPVVFAGEPGTGRLVKLIVEGRGEGEWLIPLDDPETPPDTEPTATVAIDGVEFCHLCAGRRDPHRMPVGITGDRTLARALLAAAPLLSRP